MEKDFICKYCGKICKNANSLRNHERLCKENPNHQISFFVKYNAECSNGERIIWNKGLTKDNDYRVKKQSNTLKEKYSKKELVSSFKGKHHTEENKKILSEKRKQIIPSLMAYVVRVEHAGREGNGCSVWYDFVRDVFGRCRCC